MRHYKQIEHPAIIVGTNSDTANTIIINKQPQPQPQPQPQQGGKAQLFNRLRRSASSSPSPSQRSKVQLQSFHGVSPITPTPPSSSSNGMQRVDSRGPGSNNNNSNNGNGNSNGSNTSGIYRVDSRGRKVLVGDTNATRRSSAASSNSNNSGGGGGGGRVKITHHQSGRSNNVKEVCLNTTKTKQRQQHEQHEQHQQQPQLPNSSTTQTTPPTTTRRRSKTNSLISQKENHPLDALVEEGESPQCKPTKPRQPLTPPRNDTKQLKEQQQGSGGYITSSGNISGTRSHLTKQHQPAPYRIHSGGTTNDLMSGYIHPPPNTPSRNHRCYIPPPPNTPNPKRLLYTDPPGVGNNSHYNHGHPSHICPSEVVVNHSASIDMSCMDYNPSPKHKSKHNNRNNNTNNTHHRNTPPENYHHPTCSATPLSTACAVALSFVGGVGGVVEKIVSDINRITLCYDDDQTVASGFTYISRKGSNLTLDTFGEDLADDMSKLERMTSWDTHDTFTTIGTMNTVNTVMTNDESIASSLVSEVRMSGGGDSSNSLLPELDDDGNMISARVVQAHQSRKERFSILSKLGEGRNNEENPLTDRSLPSPLNQQQQPNSNQKKTKQHQRTKPKSKPKKRKKVVKFDYPPISSLRECPRVTDAEKDALFFTEDELDQYDFDRRHNLNDDVEVVAVHESDSESEEEESKCSTPAVAAVTTTPDKMDATAVRSPSASSSNEELMSASSLVSKTSSGSKSSKAKLRQGLKGGIGGKVPSSSPNKKTALRDGKYTTKKRVITSPGVIIKSTTHKGKITKPQPHTTTSTPESNLNSQKNTPKKGGDQIVQSTSKTDEMSSSSSLPKYSTPPKISKTDSESTTQRKGGKRKLKGVQIYLRQRTVQ